jgi:DNA-binding NarL/FixJ family response regulator
VAAHVGASLMIKQIATAMGPTPRTIKLHLANIYRKLKLSGIRERERRWAELSAPAA